MSRSSGRSIFIPAVVVVVLVWLMVGCLYIPTSNQVNYSPGHLDFRPYLSRADDAGWISVGRITRGEVIAMLGTPSLASVDGTAVGYVFEERHGLWVWPQCFAAGTAAYAVHALRLDFGADDVLRDVHVAVHGSDASPGSVGLFREPANVCEYHLRQDLEDLNRIGPALVERGGRPLFDNRDTFQTVWEPAEPAATHSTSTTAP